MTPRDRALAAIDKMLTAERLANRRAGQDRDRALYEAAIRETLAYLHIDNPRAEPEWIPEILYRLAQRPAHPAEIGDRSHPAPSLVAPPASR